MKRRGSCSVIRPSEASVPEGDNLGLNARSRYVLTIDFFFLSYFFLIFCYLSSFFHCSFLSLVLVITYIYYFFLLDFGRFRGKVRGIGMLVFVVCRAASL